LNSIIVVFVMQKEIMKNLTMCSVLDFNTKLKDTKIY
jgi:hypothetical protein